MLGPVTNTRPYHASTVKPSVRPCDIAPYGEKEVGRQSHGDHRWRAQREGNPETEELFHNTVGSLDRHKTLEITHHVLPFFHSVDSSRWRENISKSFQEWRI